MAAGGTPGPRLEAITSSELSVGGALHLCITHTRAALRCAVPYCSVGKILRLRQKVTSIKDSITGLFSKPSAGDKDTSSEKLDAFKGAC